MFSGDVTYRYHQHWYWSHDERFYHSSFYPYYSQYYQLYGMWGRRMSPIIIDYLYFIIIGITTVVIVLNFIIPDIITINFGFGLGFRV